MRTLPFEEEIGSLDELDQARRRRQRVRRLPYDYVALFRLTGRRGSIVPATINISAEAWFICTSIGYSLEEPEPPANGNGPVINLAAGPGGLSFKYAIIDKGSGRELQNTPIHNLAGLGAPDGVRPFRELVVPYVFAPNSSIVVELHEITTVANGIVHINFQGYKEFR
jgi:hypothetical protein